MRVVSLPQAVRGIARLGGERLDPAWKGIVKIGRGRIRQKAAVIRKIGSVIGEMPEPERFAIFPAAETIVGNMVLRPGIRRPVRHRHRQRRCQSDKANSNAPTHAGSPQQPRTKPWPAMKVLPRIALYNMAHVTIAAKISLQGLYCARLSAFHKGAKTLPPEPFAALDDQLSTQKHFLHPAGDAAALE